jgi:hypothetical protein
MEIGKTKIEFLGFEISKGQIPLQEQILNTFDHFLDIISEKCSFLDFKEV